MIVNKILIFGKYCNRLLDLQLAHWVRVTHQARPSTTFKWLVGAYEYLRWIALPSSDRTRANYFHGSVLATSLQAQTSDIARLPDFNFNSTVTTSAPKMKSFQVFLRPLGFGTGKPLALTQAVAGSTFRDLAQCRALGTRYRGELCPLVPLDFGTLRKPSGLSNRPTINRPHLQAAREIVLLMAF